MYREEGVSAKNMERPELQKLLNELNQFDVVLVYKLDRLSRSVIDVNKLLEQFEKEKVAFKSLQSLMIRHRRRVRCSLTLSLHLHNLNWNN